jgi:hypothetical protein
MSTPNALMPHHLGIYCEDVGDGLLVEVNPKPNTIAEAERPRIVCGLQVCANEDRLVLSDFEIVGAVPNHDRGPVTTLVGAFGARYFREMLPLAILLHSGRLTFKVRPLPREVPPQRSGQLALALALKLTVPAEAVFRAVEVW